MLFNLNMPKFEKIWPKLQYERSDLGRVMGCLEGSLVGG